MGKGRSYPPSGPAWTPAELLAARLALLAATRPGSGGPAVAHDAALWCDWWADMHATFGRAACLGDLCGSHRGTIP